MSRVIFVGVFLLLITLFLHWRFLSLTRMPTRPKRAVDAALALLWLGAVIGFGSGVEFDPSWARGPAFVGLSWLAVVLYLFLGTILVAVVCTVVRVVFAARKRDSSAVRLRVSRIGSAAVALVSVVAVGYGLVEAATPRATNTDVVLDRLPAEFDGVRVALVSDLHVGPSRGVDFVQKVVDSINAQNPDVVVLDGDLIDGTVALVGEDLEPLRDLEAPLGVFAVSGNHEFYAGDGGEWLDFWSTLGIDVLRNERTTITRGDAAIDIAGINDATAPAPYEPDLAAALDGIDPDRFVLLMAHQPLQAVEASDFGVDMQVSGHTHGGQIWPIRYLVPLQQPSVQGLDTIGNTTLYTTRGAGAWGPPVRVAAPPEIAMLELTRG
ncbi:MULTISPECIES: metallophosphoesterase [unclassified Rhodococcus (in: high G+C Gram-positive bacteria)]|uniref:metallophosphoesterase n=1 Tax=unclassified Rhodococcus (in: high G+C Gram-positive bacteria) TaxID=192944 RepID=UPI000B9A2C21|nr:MULTISPECIES: metallophosphoesterase [unclassified Rhodococcus (in: high G+C Gram-positive bacteria)]OZE31329.1 metallophosphoesterase [Rhodococcus sp. 05-2254-4]OZE41762.1 metallophosphoesterase [Rhodococcus sp. 05-2254-3]OZE52197.1 metallophosphoesterase [Rhodococcus sp. 05-2254-2]